MILQPLFIDDEAVEKARRSAMSKITAEHLSRRACVYVRQSTPDQVQNNLESQRRQYALVDRARQLGWQQVEVIDMISGAPV